MSRFLFVPLPLPGHAYPIAAVADAVRARGHEVAWVGPEKYLRSFLSAADTVHPTGMRPYRGQRDLGARAIKSVWEGFVVPYAAFTLSAVEHAVRVWQPDAVVADQHALAGALVSCRHGLPWATLATGAMELTQPFRERPKVDAWIHAHLAAAWAAAGLAGTPSVDLRFSPHLVLALTTPALTGEVSFPDHYALLGPAFGDRRDGTSGGGQGPDLAPDRQAVLVSMGTLAQDLSVGFYSRVVRALAPLAGRLQAIVVAPPEAVPEPPPHVLVTPRVPMLQLLPRLDAVLTHGGQNTVCETLAHGVPLVLAPIKHDQPIIANQVVQAGAGIRVRFHRVRPEQLRETLLAVLEDPAYREAAARVGDSFAAAGGAPAAAGRLAALAERGIRAGS
jgi:zeaxanthin glucosyltransferase